MTYPFLTSMLIVLLLSTASALVGRCFAVAVRARILLHREPESLLACMFAGTGLLTLTSGWGTYLGMPAPEALSLSMILTGGLAIVALLRGRLINLIRPPKHYGILALIVGCLLLRAGLCLYPLLLGCSLSPYNDTFCYISVAEYLQTRDFITPAPIDPDRPTWAMVTALQGLSHRMGPIYLLAMVQAAIPPLSAFELYPAVIAWGTALNVAGAFLLARWGLRVPRHAALAGAFLAAVAADSLTLSAGCGFLCSVYGTATLAFGLAVLLRLTAIVNWRVGNACLFGLCASMQFSMYGELSPLLGLASIVWLIQNGLRARSRGQFRLFIKLVVATVLTIIALANIEIIRVYHALYAMTALHGVGWHVPWRTIKFFKFASGAHMVDWLYAVSSSGIKTILLFGLASTTILLGVATVWRARQRTLPLIFALLVFVGLALWSRYYSRDPWTGEIGHTFNLFKLCQWVFPFALALKMAGLYRLLRSVQHRGCSPALATAMICVGVAAIHLPVQHQGSRKVQARVWLEKGTPHPMQEFSALRRRIDELGPSTIFYVQDPAGAVNNSFIAYTLNRYPFLNSWTHAGQVGAPWLGQDQYDRCDAGTLFLQLGEPPFEEPAEKLPFNYSVIDQTRPVVFAISDAKATTNDFSGRKDYWPITTTLYLEVVTPRACQVEMMVSVVFQSADAPPIAPLIAIEGQSPASINGEPTADQMSVFFAPVSIPRGLSRIAIRDATEGRSAWGIRDVKLRELTSSGPIRNSSP